MWIKPIFDRTQSDITNNTDKGRLQFSDMNRIENNIQFIADEIGITVNIETWARDKHLTKQEWDRILDNIEIIKANWNIPNIPSNPEHPINQFMKLNTIERIEFLIMNNIIATKDVFIRCGTEAYAGSVIGVI